jgi:hypothetical protein
LEVVMGLAVRVETEDGSRIAEVLDPTNVLHRLLPSEDDDTYHCLRYVDWYGNTVFNRLQMETVLRELDRIRLAVHGAGELELLDRLKELAHRCEAEPHLYLKFYGD